MKGHEKLHLPTCSIKIIKLLCNISYRVPKNMFTRNTFQVEE